MRAGTVILWRHGQTDWNAEQRLQGQSDIPLNATGRAQAAVAADALLAYRPTVVVASDLGRARETGAMLADKLGVTMFTDARLRERGFGEFEGRTHEDMAERWPRAFAQWRAGLDPDGIGAEPRVALGERMREAVADWSSRHDAETTVVFASHGAAIATCVIAMLGLDVAGWRGIGGLNNCHWSVLRPASGDPGWRLAGHNIGAPSPDFPLGAPIV